MFKPSHFRFLWHIALPFSLATSAYTVIGCGSGGASEAAVDEVTIDPAGGPGGKADGTAPVVPAGAVAVIEIYPLDIWAQYLPASDMKLEVSGERGPYTTTGNPMRYVPLTGPDTLQIRLSAEGYVPVDVTVEYDGGTGVEAFTARAASGTERQGFSVSHQPLLYDDVALSTHSLYLGLRHKWFSSQGRPARRGNEIDLLMDGEEAWENVYVDLQAASESVLISTWWWESNFELVRDAETHHLLDSQVRWGNTILGMLEQSPAHKRVLVGQFWGQDSILSWMTSDSKLRAHADVAGDGFEFMGMANETKGKFFFEPAPFSFGERARDAHTELGSRAMKEKEIYSNVPSRSVDLTKWPVGVNMQHASYHQKFMVIDHDVAYVGGMNFRRVDWDTSEHKVFDHRRMLYGASLSDRQAVLDRKKLPDTGPRKDYMIRVHGPAAQDVADVFKKRWDVQLERGVEYASKSTPFEVKRSIAPRAGSQVQVTATLPQPLWEHAIAETWINAIGEAERFIFIEDQYFRMPMINEYIAARMDAKPDLRLVVITKPVSDWTDPGCEWTSKSHELFKSRFPSRYMMLQLRAFDYVETWGINETESRFMDMDVHSKMLIVDDTFMSVGSCNKNNRGLVYEGELNVAVVDDVWVTEARHRILANVLPAGTVPGEDVDGWWPQLAQAAAYNDAVYAKWKAAGFDIDLNGAPLPQAYTPRGFLYSLDFLPSSKCFIEGVGEDMVTR
jgi:phosphatidylserine/phosphatidylglycerophosphate/cardiolipin synthase-like enzyme